MHAINRLLVTFPLSAPVAFHYTSFNLADTSNRSYPSSPSMAKRAVADSKDDEVDDLPLVESIYQAILERIVSGRLQDGAIVSELALSHDLGVSRTPVHDAVRQLVKDSLVVWERGRRPRVARFTSDDIYQIFEMRKYLEGPAAELAAGRMDRRHLTPLRNGIDALQTSRNDGTWTERWAEFDDQFHSVIAEASGNRRLAADINRYRLLHKVFNRMATDPDGLQSAMREHLGILEALENHDGKLARERMIAHISVWQDYFVQKLQRSSEKGR